MQANPWDFGLSNGFLEHQQQRKKERMEGGREERRERKEKKKERKNRFVGCHQHLKIFVLQITPQESEKKGEAVEKLEPLCICWWAQKTRQLMWKTV